MNVAPTKLRAFWTMLVKFAYIYQLSHIEYRIEDYLFAVVTGQGQQTCTSILCSLITTCWLLFIGHHLPISAYTTGQRGFSLFQVFLLCYYNIMYWGFSSEQRDKPIPGKFSGQKQNVGNKLRSEYMTTLQTAHIIAPFIEHRYLQSRGYKG